MLQFWIISSILTIVTMKLISNLLFRRAKKEGYVRNKYKGSNNPFMLFILIIPVINIFILVISLMSLDRVYRELIDKYFD